MLNRQRLFGLVGLLIFYGVGAFAGDISTSVVNAVDVGKFEIGVGSTLILKSSDDKINGTSLFLGNVIAPNGSHNYHMFLNSRDKKVYYIDSSHFVKNSKLQKILDPYEQAGGTCAGYSIDQFMLQTNLAGFVGTGELAKTLKTEEGRSHLLADSINQYYLNSSHRYSIRGILNGFGKTFGFSCKTLTADTYEKLKIKILTHVKMGLPVIVSFDIGPKMVKSPFVMQNYDQDTKLDGRLWIPRKRGERNSGGHSIVAAASFELKNKTYLVMLDSDWSEPRIWDMDSFINERTSLDEIDLVICK